MNNTAAVSSATRSLLPGAVVLDRYTVQKVIGRGGMATVYLAQNNETERLVALKILDPEISNDPSYVERFRREARAAGRIRSDHVVAIYDLGTDTSGTLVLVMEFLEGQTVQQALRAGRLPVARALTLTRQLCEGLAAAHENGVIHRDLKPANLFIERLPAGAEKLKILDFGISKLAEASSQELTRAGQTLGTLAYMAPEQIRGTVKGNDPRIDLYSAGVSIFLMLTAKRPIDADDTVQLLQAVLEKAPLSLTQAAGVEFPQPLEAFVAKALSKDPTRRYQTALEMRDALVEVMNLGAAPMAMNTWGSSGDVASTVISEAPQIPAHLLPTATPPSGVIVSGPATPAPGPALTLPAFEDDDDEGKTVVRAPVAMPGDSPAVLPAAGRRMGSPSEPSPRPSTPMRAPTMAPIGPPPGPRLPSLQNHPPPPMAMGGLPGGLPSGLPSGLSGPLPNPAPPPPGEATMIANPGDPALQAFGAPPPPAPSLGQAPVSPFGPPPAGFPSASPFAPPPLAPPSAAAAPVSPRTTGKRSKLVPILAAAAIVAIGLVGAVGWVVTHPARTAPSSPTAPQPISAVQTAATVPEAEPAPSPVVPAPSAPAVAPPSPSAPAPVAQALAPTPSPSPTTAVAPSPSSPTAPLPTAQESPTTPPTPPSTVAAATTHRERPSRATTVHRSPSAPATERRTNPRHATAHAQNATPATTTTRVAVRPADQNAPPPAASHTNRRNRRRSAVIAEVPF